MREIPEDNSGGYHAFSARPSSGRAPLSVTFFSFYNNQTRPTLDYGDGTHEQIAVCINRNNRGNNCTDPGRNTHVYRSPGNYTARVVQSFCPPGAKCFAPEKVLESVIIRVSR